MNSRAMNHRMKGLLVTKVYLGVLARKAFLVMPFLFGLMLSSCATNEARIEPTPLERIEKKVSFNRLWSRQVGSGFTENSNRFTPALSDQFIFANDGKGTVLALDLEAGKVQWKQSLKQPLVGGVAIDGDSLWVSTRSGQLISLSSDTGEVQWLSELSSLALAPVAANNQVVVVQSQDGHVSCLDRQTGEAIWVVDTQVPVLSLYGTSRPMIVANQVLAGFANGKLMSFDIKSGQLQWARQVGQVQGAAELERLVDIDGDFVVDDIAVIAAGYHGGVMALSQRAGQPFWQQSVDSSRPLAMSLGALFVSDTKSLIWRLDLRSGEPDWTFEAFKGRDVSGPAVIGDYVLVGDMEGFLHVLDRYDGQQLGRYRVDNSAVTTTPLINRSEETVYVYSTDGKLVALRIQAVD